MTLNQAAFSAVHSREDFEESATHLDYIHLALVDINGVARTKVYPAELAKELAEEGASVEISMAAFGLDGSNPPIEDHYRHNLGNIVIRPIFSTLRSWPWHGQQTGAKMGQILCSAHWLDNRPIEADTRAMAVRQVQRLKDRGLDIFIGTEAEFRLFDATVDIANDHLPTAHNNVNMYLPRHYRQYEKFYVEMDRRMRSIGFKFLTFHTEYGKGQMEMPLAPDWGVEAADNLMRFKLLAHDTALDIGYRCSFMSKPFQDQTGNGFHFNHSIWRRDGKSQPIENVMLDEHDPQKISNFTRHWIAGLMHHGAALTALCSPTVNCYRRLHQPWAPDFNNWAFDDRMTAWRVKNNGSAKGTFVENRSPSSASNPYLVLAGVIAAGLDGVDRKLQPPAERSNELGALPRSLPEALDAFRKDEILCAALGPQFVDWFLTVKEKEIEQLGVTSLEAASTEDFRKERLMYFDIV